MPRLEPSLVPVVTDLERGLRELGIPFGIVGALVPELLLNARPRRMTNDADVTVIVDSLADFNALKDRLSAYGFTRTRVPHRMQHRDGGLMDLLPFSATIAPDGRLQLDDGVVFNMAGFSHVVPNAVSTPIEGGPNLPLAPLPLYALLKLVAFSDRKAAKDLGGVLHCLQHYLEDDERRYGVDHDDVGVPFEYTCAYLLGIDGQRFLDVALSNTARAVLNRFDEPEADVVGIAAGERRPGMIEDQHRTEIFELFRWYRLGTGL
jgi:predicted nucleotidyltransferase